MTSRVRSRWMIAELAALAAAAAATAAPKKENTSEQRGLLDGRWNVAFHMPQGSYETPIEFVTSGGGAVRATVLGPLGTLSIADAIGSFKANKLTLKANTSRGRLKVGATLEGDRLRGRWSPASIVASLFFKGEMVGLRDRAYVPKPRVAAFDAAWTHIERHFYSPSFNGVDAKALRLRYRSQVAATRTDSDFIILMRQMLGEFRTSHLDFFATPTWTQELHPAAPPTAAASAATEGVTWRQLAPSVGYIGIASFEEGPKVVARVDQAFAAVGNNAALVIDLRGNGGGTLSAAMRLGDYVLSRMQPVGYFANRDGLIRYGVDSIDKIDGSILPVFAGYSGDDFAQEMARAGALMLTTGGRAARPYRGRAVVLVDEYCFSACEALASIVKETGAATLVGRSTPGAMLAATGVPVDGGWMLLLPISDFRTPEGVRVEGRGVKPDVAVKYRSGKDADIAAALKFLN